MLDRDEILALIPHQGAMCLWDEVAAWTGTTVALRARNHRDLAHPLRSAATDGASMLRAVHLCEYGAQAMAVHGGLLARASGAAPKAGMLVALRGVSLRVARIDDLPGDLEGSAELLADGAGSQQYAFRIAHAGDTIAEGRAAVMLQPIPG